MVLADGKLKLREIADTLKISEDSVFIILLEHLSETFEMDTAFSHSPSKTTTRQGFRALFGAVLVQ